MNLSEKTTLTGREYLARHEEYFAPVSVVYSLIFILLLLLLSAHTLSACLTTSTYGSAIISVP